LAAGARGTTERRFELEMGQTLGIGLGLGNSRGPNISVERGGELAGLVLAGGKRASVYNSVHERIQIQDIRSGCQ
jgi:hypothetical protein